MSTRLEGMEPRLKHLAAKYSRWRPALYDDMLGEAWLATVKTASRYDPTRGATLETAAYGAATFELKDFCKAEARQPLTLTLHRNDEGRACTALDNLQSRREFNLGTFLLEVSEDAATACRLALEAPGELMPRQVGRWLRGTLLGMGWAGARIGRVFGELREAFGG